MPENNAHHHLAFRKMDIENARKKQGAPVKRIERDNVKYGKEIEVAVKSLQDQYEQVIENNPPEFDPALIFRIKIDKGQVSEDDWRRSGLTLLSEELDNFVVLFSEDQLSEFRNRIELFGREIPEGQKAPQYGWIASLATEMNIWGRENRLGKKLAKIQINADEQYALDVELWTYGSREDLQARMDELKSYVENHNGQFLDFYISLDLSVARIRITGNTLMQLLDVGIIEMVDLPPQPELRIGQLLNTPLDDFPNPVTPPSDDAQKICVIDSGIAAGHPLLGPAIGELVPIPASLGSGLDLHGHGTRVAAIALYGDVQDCVEHLDFTAQFFIFGARVTNDNNRFDDEKLIVHQMDEAIRGFHESYGCRIFNISLADPELVYDGGKPSQWAQILDSLARELDVVIIVSAGNVSVAGLSGEDAERIQGNYPQYLLETQSRILEPATAVNVLTVGALAKRMYPRDAARFPNDPSIYTIAETDQPSPFTRSGPGVNNSIKPDVCEYGGNLTWNGRLRTILNNDIEVGIMSMSHDFVRRLFTSDIGTSYAAPAVANLAGRILNEYPQTSANLTRALIANSASIPEAIYDTLDDDSVQRLYGYGRPDISRALFSTDNRVTLVAEDNISLDKLHVYQIPIPDSFKVTNGRRTISVCLAFDPPVRHTRKGYLGIKMDFVLLRGLTTERIVDWYSAREENEDDIDKIPQKYVCDLFPSPTKRNGGTLQKGIWSASQNRTLLNYDGDCFHLVVRCKAASWLPADEDEKQKYALAVTLEHFDPSIELYNTVQQSVRVEERIRVQPR